RLIRVVPRFVELLAGILTGLLELLARVLTRLLELLRGVLAGLLDLVGGLVDVVFAAAGRGTPKRENAGGEERGRAAGPRNAHRRALLRLLGRRLRLLSLAGARLGFGCLAAGAGRAFVRGRRVAVGLELVFGRAAPVLASLLAAALEVLTALAAARDRQHGE